MHKTSYDEMKRIIGERLRAERDKPLRVLDVGSLNVNGSYKPHMFPAWTYTGCDISAGANVDVVQDDPYELPFDAESFNLVICGQVLEHVERPWVLVPEMARVLVPGGLLIIAAPWQWGIHRYPLDCWRILPDGMSVLLNDAKLQNIQAYINASDCWGIGTK